MDSGLHITAELIRNVFGLEPLHKLRVALKACGRCGAVKTLFEQPKQDGVFVILGDDHPVFVIRVTPMRLDARPKILAFQFQVALFR